MWHNGIIFQKYRQTDWQTDAPQISKIKSKLSATVWQTLWLNFWRKPKVYLYTNNIVLWKCISDVNCDYYWAEIHSPICLQEILLSITEKSSTYENHGNETRIQTPSIPWEKYNCFDHTELYGQYGEVSSKNQQIKDQVSVLV